METIMYLVGYGEYLKNVEKGWGCGYVMIPINHPIVLKWNADRAEEEKNSDPEEFYPDKYMSFLSSEEITYTEYKTVSGVEYVVVGFDTAHSWNHKGHDFDYVFQRTTILKAEIDNYK